jgi:hypothetical protein
MLGAVGVLLIAILLAIVLLFPNYRRIHEREGGVFSEPASSVVQA